MSVCDAPDVSEAGCTWVPWPAAPYASGMAGQMSLGTPLGGRTSLGLRPNCTVCRLHGSSGLGFLETRFWTCSCVRIPKAIMDNTAGQVPHGSVNSWNSWNSVRYSVRTVSDPFVNVRGFCRFWQKWSEQCLGRSDRSRGRLDVVFRRFVTRLG